MSEAILVCQNKVDLLQLPADERILQIIGGDGKYWILKLDITRSCDHSCQSTKVRPVHTKLQAVISKAHSTMPEITLKIANK
jgi:hypothetical protein